MSLTQFPTAQKRSRLLACSGALGLVVLIAVGVFAKNGWFPSTDPLTGKKTGWFGQPLAKNASSSWNPLAPSVPSPTPQLSKEYIYAGSRLLAVEDANASAAPLADIAIWRPNPTGVWWVMGGAGGSNAVTQGWGQSTDKPVQGDYDGDGKTDFAVYRPSTQEWYILQSSDGAWGAVMAWGLATDVRLPADYDGDGKTDRAVWRASDNVWYIVRSSDAGFTYFQYGSSGDVPAPADYDGDGKTDFGLWRASDQNFYWIPTSTGTATSLSIGQAGTEPVSADYDGDGRADHAIRNGANWIIRQSSNGQTITVSWEQASDRAVPHDYDGDAKVDIATWRDSNGTWYIRASASGNALRQVQWGLSGDEPVPATYRR